MKTGSRIGLVGRTGYRDLPAVFVAVGIAAWIVASADELSFFFDEWSWVLGRSFSLQSLWESHNGHLVLLPAVLFMGLVELFGTDSYLPFLLLSVGAHTLTGLLTYAVVRSRSGRALGMAGLVTVMLLGSGWMNIVWGFQVQMILPVACALAGIAVLDRKPDADASVALLVALAVASQGGGLAVLAGFWVHGLVSRAWKRVVMLTGVFGSYLVWMVLYGEQQGSSANIGIVPRYLYDAAAYSAAAVGGRDRWFAVVVLIVLLAGLVYRGRAVLTQPATVVPLVAVITGWFLTGYARGDLYEPNASRYVYVGAIYLLVAILGCAPRPTSAALTILLVPVAAFVVQPNVQLLRDGIRNLENVTSIVRADLAVIEAVGDIGHDGYRPNLDLAPQIFAGPYLRAASRHGSMGFDIADAEGFSEGQRRDMDRVAFGYLGVVAEETRDDPGWTQGAAGDLSVSSCSSIPVRRNEWFDLMEQWVVVTHRAPVRVSFRMFADQSSEATELLLDGSGSTLLRVPPHRSLPNWRMRASKRVTIAECQAREESPTK